MRALFLWAAIAGLFFLSGSGLALTTTEKKVESEKTPGASASPIAQNPTPPPVMPYEKLIPFLPETPPKWSAEKPSGSTTEIEVFNLSTATRTYQKGDDEDAPVVTVTIIDAGGHKGYFDTVTVKWKVNIETPQGYDKSVEIDGMPGYEHYSKAAKSASLSVIVAKRFFIQIEVTNLPPQALREWLKKIDIQKLAELK